MRPTIELPATAPTWRAATPRRILTGARRNKLLTVGVVLAGLVVMAALLAQLISPYPSDAADATHPAITLARPSGAHWFGTDSVGRDIFTRVLFAGRVSLGIAVSVLIVAGAVGLAVGLVAGFFGGLVETALMRITDVFLAFPALLLSIALAAVLNASATHAAFAIAATWWPWYARLARSQAASIRRTGFSDAARVLGAGWGRQLLRHVLPNAATPVFVQMSLDAAGIILTAATLSYLGLGAQDPTPEWGLMVSQGQALATTAWWVVTFPGIAILLTAVAFNFIGDGLQTALDPKRGQR